MKKILIIGDSTVLPRKEVSFWNTYIGLLNKNCKKYNFFMNAKEGLTTKQVFQNLDYYLLYGLQPDMVILNIGIVDSYPRPLPIKLNKLLNCLQIGGELNIC